MFLATPNGVAAALRMEGLMNSIPIRDNLTRPADGGVRACRNPVWLGNAPTLPQDSRVRQPWGSFKDVSASGNIETPRNKLKLSDV